MLTNELFELVRAALAIVGPPEWPSAETPGQVERLTLLDAAEAHGQATWALISDTDNDFTPIDACLAADLVRCHFRGCLAQRGWQVQMTLAGARRQWRLVDCLAFADGGGDRLDGDYPFGEDELCVLCESVVTVATEARPRRIAGP